MFSPRKFQVFLLMVLLLFSWVGSAIGEEQGREPVIGLALSGGASWGFSHIGVIEVLEEHGIFPEVIAGTSAGAIVGSLYASGKSVPELREIAENIRYWDFLVPSIPDLGFFSTRGIMNQIKRHIPHDDFDQLEKKFGVITVDLVRGETYIFKEGSVSTAVAASSAQPIVFNPVRYEDMLLVDGGVLQNLPDTLAWELGADIVIAVSLNENFSFEGVPDGHIDVAVRTYNLLQRGRVLEVKADVIITPNVTGMGGGQLQAANLIIEKGREATEEKIPEILEIIEEFKQRDQ